MLSLPSLAGVPLSYTYREDADILIPVAEFMIRYGYATDADWTGDLGKFTQAGIDRIIRSTRISEFTEDAPPLTATLADHEGYYTRHGHELDKKHLLLGIGGDECGYFRMGAITRKLERTATGLGAAFYAAVVDSLDEVGWIFDYTRAMYVYGSQREMIEDENGKGWDEMNAEERSAYELIDPDKAFPEHLWAVKHGGITAARRDLLMAHRARHPKVIGLALQMCDLAAKLHRYEKQHPEGDAPCTYLIFIEDYDPMTAYFDEWSQHFLEGDVTYVWNRCFNPANHTELKKAFEAFELTVRLLSTAAQLAPVVNGVKK